MTRSSPVEGRSPESVALDSGPDVEVLHGPMAETPDSDLRDFSDHPDYPDVEPHDCIEEGCADA